MGETSLNQLRQIYSAIIQGFVATSYNKAPLYIRHFSPIEQAEIDEHYAGFLARAKGEGLSSEEEQLALLKKQGVWGDAEDLEVKQLKFEVEELIGIKKTVLFPSQLEQIKVQIEVAEKRWLDKLKERADLLTLTAESFASQKVNEVYIYKSLYADKELKTPFFSDEDYQDLDRAEISALITLYNSKVSDFSDKNLQKVAVSGFFQDYYGLCENDITNFYGKPIVYLTYYQSALARHGKYFHTLFMSENRPPDNIMGDPDKIIDWVTTTSNAKRLAAKTEATGEGGAASFVGATKKDLEAMGMAPSTVSLKDKAKGKSSMNMQEMMAAAGVS